MPLRHDDEVLIEDLYTTDFEISLGKVRLGYRFGSMRWSADGPERSSIEGARITGGELDGMTLDERTLRAVVASHTDRSFYQEMVSTAWGYFDQIRDDLRRDTR